ncbi:MAG: ABC transporter permease [Actinomycetales bacterium]|jgi:putative spermidine/putrescine transport system permease protein
MKLSRTARATLIGMMVFGFTFIYLPLALVVINSFNTNKSFAWPPTGFTTIWWSKAAANDGIRDAVLRSVITAVIATSIALILGSLAAAAISRYDFFGRDAISLLFVLPIALPGIVTGIALNNVFTNFFGKLTFFTIVIGHATFCIVVVFNNVAARYRRLGMNLQEASMDLGASRFTTFRLVTFPLIRSALVAGGLLAFGLSFDEIIVTTFTAGAGQTTLPIWIFQNLFRPNQAPIVNVVAAALILISILPIYLSQRLTAEK